MRSTPALSVVIGWAGTAQAGCLLNEQTFMACQINGSGKTLRVCLDDTTAHYRFGSAGALPDAALCATINDVD